MAQWLRLCASSSECIGSIPGQGTQIPYTYIGAWPKKKNIQKKKKKALPSADQLFKSQPPANVKWVKFLQGRNRPISLFCTFILLLV